MVNVVKKGEIYSAQKGEGAFKNENKIQTSNCVDVNKAIVAMDFGKENRQRGVPYYSRMLAKDGVSYPSVLASTSVSMVLVAEGKIDVYASVGSDPWDYAAAVIIAREAGCKVTTIEGKEWELGDDTILVANPELHGKFLDLFKDIEK